MAAPWFREIKVTQESQGGSQLQDQKPWKRHAFYQVTEHTEWERELLEHRDLLGSGGGGALLLE